MHENTRETSPSDIRVLLRQEHGRLDKMFEDLLATFRSGAREEAAQQWTAFDAGLLAHLALEEERIFPEFAKVDPVEAAALAKEHVAIRALVDELGVGMDLHLTRAEAVAELVGALKNHANREDALMYRWAPVGAGRTARGRPDNDSGADARRRSADWWRGHSGHVIREWDLFWLLVKRVS